jgi:integrase
MSADGEKPKRPRRRRGRGEDSIYQRSSDKRWIVEIREGYKPSGKPNIIYITAKSKVEVQRKHREARLQLARGMPTTNDVQTVSSWLTYWLEHKVKPAKRATTYEGYESVIRVHIIPAIGRKHLAKLTAIDVQALMTKMLESGVSPTTAKNARVVLRKALNDAMRDDLIGRNVVTLTDMPRQETFHAKPLTADELPRFLAATKGHRLEALWLTFVTIGLRAGEAFGVRWEDVDLQNGSLRVRYQIQRTGRPPQARFVDPKTDRSRRPVPLPTPLVASLRDHRERQSEEITLAGSRWKGDDWQHLVFCTTIGTPLDPSNVLRQYREVLETAGLDADRRVHDLRHTCGTMLARLGVHPREAQEILRHSQIQTTLGIYTHVSSEGVRSAIDRLGDMLSDSGAEKDQT